MEKLKQGKIVIMLSSAVVNISPKALNQYTTIKYTLLGLVKSLVGEYTDKNIQINSIPPLIIEIKFLENINEIFVELNAYNHLIKRNANVDEVTPAIKILISKESGYVGEVNVSITDGSVF